MTDEALTKQAIADALRAAPAAKRKQEPRRDQAKTSDEEPFDVAGFAHRRGLAIAREEQGKRGVTKFVLATCPWGGEEHADMAFIERYPKGGVGAGCAHPGCAGKDWNDLKESTKKRKGRKGSGKGNELESRTCGQIVRDALYEGHWLAVDGDLYQWEGTHYLLRPRAREMARVAAFLDEFEVKDDDGNVKHPLAEASAVHAAIAWVVHIFSVPSNLVNQGGINCRNGFLRITFNDGAPSWALEEHDPKRHLVTYAPEATFDPDADPTACDGMLAALEPAEREIFLRTAAASLDMEAVRAILGRGVRGIIALGNGNNGKDTLRTAVTQVLGGQAVTGCSLSDFRLYDQGRKFGLAPLRFSRINWCSENAAVGKLETLKSLMAAITGDPIDIEMKGKDLYQHTPQTVFIFNLNDPPDLTGALEAIKSRYAILSFAKTYVLNPDPAQGELLADPRMKYDAAYRRHAILPALLNRLLAALAALMSEGIDYAPVEANLAALRRERNHLYDFAKAAGLGIRMGHKVYAGVIWDALKAWYVRNQIVTVERKFEGGEKLIWEDSPRGDRYVKAPNQVPARFLELFPQAKGDRDEGGSFLFHLGMADATASGSDAVAELRQPSQGKVVPLFQGSTDALTQRSMYHAHAGEALTPAVGDHHAHVHARSMAPDASVRQQITANPPAASVSSDSDCVNNASGPDATASGLSGDDYAEVIV